MRDFTLDTFRLLLSTLKNQHYTFQTFADFLKNPQPHAIILRHDVDNRKLNSLRTARIENEMGIVGTYNFRMVPQSYDEEVIREIAGMGHEIGYHYEELALMKGNFEKAIRLFEKNLLYMRQIVKIETICMHGSPLSRFDNRKLWEEYNYRDFEIIGEPYFDLDLRNVLYLTDTGGRWDGGKVSVRDKIPGLRNDLKLENRKVYKFEYEETVDSIGYSIKRNYLQLKGTLHSTFNIISFCEAGNLPDQIMINVHPQRWNEKTYIIFFEVIWQRIKNLIKRLVVSGYQLMHNGIKTK
jgi:hypothetical protein